MICNLGKICNAVGFVILFYVTTFMLVAPNAPPPSIFRKTTAFVGETWAAEDLGTLARTNKVALVVRSLKNAARKSGTPVLRVEGFQGVIDAAADAEIRAALLAVAKGGNDRKKDPLAEFSRTDNAAATCGKPGTAGSGGLALCVERCERKPSTWDLRPPRSGACYMLCSLAISPCSQGIIISWGTSSKNWAVQQRSWATAVNTMVSLIHAQGVKKAQNMTVSTALADLFFYAIAALDYAVTSRILQALCVLGLFREGWKYVRRLQKRARESIDEVTRLKLRSLFKIRARLLKQEGFNALHEAGAWAIYRESFEAAKAERRKQACRLLGRLVSGRSKRAVATRFVQWQGAAAATVSAAAVDAAPSEADAKDGEDRVAG